MAFSVYFSSSGYGGDPWTHGTKSAARPSVVSSMRWARGEKNFHFKSLASVSIAQLKRIRVAKNAVLSRKEPRVRDMRFVGERKPLHV